MNQNEHQKIINLCNQAISAIAEQLDANTFAEVNDYINKHNEWLIGIENAIGYLHENNMAITSEAYSKFKSAFDAMNQNNNQYFIELQRNFNDD